MHSLTTQTLLRNASISLLTAATLINLTACTGTPTGTATPLPTATETEVPPVEDTTTPVPPTATPTPTLSATYFLTFEATWSETTHPIDFPPNPHFSGLIGATHISGSVLWEEGELASLGIKNMAETGGKSPLDSEIESLIDKGLACELISGGGINPSPGAVTLTFTANLDCPFVSIVSMIAPSPDWFVGVSGLSLLEDGQWTQEIVVQLLPFDAGTDSGEVYTSADYPTADPETIYPITTQPFVNEEGATTLGIFTISRIDS